MCVSGIWRMDKMAGGEGKGNKMRREHDRGRHRVKPSESPVEAPAPRQDFVNTALGKLVQNGCAGSGIAPPTPAHHVGVSASNSCSRASNLARTRLVADGVQARQAGDWVPLDAIHQLAEQPPVGMGREGILAGYIWGQNPLAEAAGVGDDVGELAPMDEEGDITAVTGRAWRPPKDGKLIICNEAAPQRRSWPYCPR